MAYLWTKLLHVLFVISWMATVFYLPRILVNLSETAGQLPVTERLQLMGLRLYKFGHMMFGFALIPLVLTLIVFAWLARNTVLRRTSSLPKVTGARGARILGAVYPA